MNLASDAPWLPYDPTWLVELAKAQKPRKKWLHGALMQCTMAQAKTCCAPKTCGYYFIDATNANQPGSPWQYETTIWLDNEPDTLFVGLLIVKHRKVGGIEFI